MGLFVRYRGFRWLFAGQLLSQLGNAVFLVMGLWEIQLRSPVLLAVAGFAMVVPRLLAAFGGVLADRYNSARLMLYTDIARGVAVAIGLVALIAPGGLVPAVIGLLAVNSLGDALFTPAEAIVIPRLVDPGDLVAANGVYSLTFQVSSAVGSALGGAAIAAVGVAAVFGFDLGTFWISALAIALMLRTFAPRSPARAAGQPPEEQGFRSSLREGMAAVRKLPIVMTLLPLVILGNFTFMIAFTMLPFWVRHSLHAGAATYGLVDAAWAVGLILGGVATTVIKNWSTRAASAIAFGIQALITLAFAASTVPWLSAALFLVGGAMNGVGNALLLTVLQRLIPEEVRGRVFGMVGALFTLANPLGAVTAGLLLHAVPLFLPWVLAGATGLAFAVGLWRTVPVDFSPS